MPRRVIVLLAIVVIAGAAGVAWWYTHRSSGNERVRPLRQCRSQADGARLQRQRPDRPSTGAGRRPRKEGQVLARLDTSRLSRSRPGRGAGRRAESRRRQAHAGSRPEEIAQARANVAAARADADNARAQYERLTSLIASAGGRASVTEHDVDTAKAALDVAEARLAVSERALDLAVAGPRTEDIAQAEAQLAAIEAQLALLKQQLTDAELVAPVEGVVRSRLMEPGEMASPQRPVFSLAIVDPKWVRAYVSEPDLGKAAAPARRPRSPSTAFPDQRFEGWVGFISPVAEFTPKAVQTEELRTSLVYEVRVFVKDPSERAAPRHAGDRPPVAAARRAASTAPDGEAVTTRRRSARPVMLGPRRPQDVPPRDRRGGRGARWRVARGRPRRAHRPGRTGRRRQDHAHPAGRRIDDGRLRRADGPGTSTSPAIRRRSRTASATCRRGSGCTRI